MERPTTESNTITRLTYCVGRFRQYIRLEWSRRKRGRLMQVPKRVTGGLRVKRRLGIGCSERVEIV